MPEARRQVGFVTYHGKPDLTDDDRLVLAPLRQLGLEVIPIQWDDRAADWSRFSVSIVRSTWDYHKHPARFSRWLDQMETGGLPVWNPTGLIRWNMDKGYLRELSDRGVAITPTIWLEQGETADLPGLLRSTGWDRAVVKPRLSATAYRTWIVDRVTAGGRQDELNAMLEEGAVLVQRYEEAIEAGEWSLVFFPTGLSHAVLKVPQRGDFRVQKEYGGTSSPGTPRGAAIALAEEALREVRFPWLYARVDVIDTGREVRLMELEMLEPDLFLRHDLDAPLRFARAILAVTG